MSKHRTLQASVLGTHTLEEREAFIQRHLKNCIKDKRIPRYNTKTSGRALKGTMSVHSAKRKCATKHWKQKIKKEMQRAVQGERSSYANSQ